MRGAAGPGFCAGIRRLSAARTLYHSMVKKVKAQGLFPRRKKKGYAFFCKNAYPAAAVYDLSINDVQSVHSIIVGLASCVPTCMLESEQ